MIHHSQLERERIRRLPLILRHEVNVSLSRPLVQMSHKRRDLIPGLALGHQDRDERVPQGVVSIQPFEMRVLRIGSPRVGDA